MCVVWCTSSSNARWLMRPIQSSDSVAASKNRRAGSIAVSAAVIGVVMVKRGAKGMLSSSFDRFKSTTASQKSDVFHVGFAAKAL